MNKAKAIRLAGFVAALCVSGTLLGTTISGTGAYFTDSHDGNINASTGQVKVDLAPAGAELNFDNLLPGEPKDQQITYYAHGTSAEDIWLVFPGDVNSEALTGNPEDNYGGGLGRYGHFAVSSTNGASFVSNNLSNPRPSVQHPSVCSIDPNGEGGSPQEATDKNDYTVPYCAPSNAILLASGLTDNQSGTATLSFGYTKLLTGPQNEAIHKVVKFSIVATQHGINPTDVNNVK